MSQPVVAFFDVDGTLTYRDPVTGPTNIPTPRVQDAIRRFVDAGNVAVVCTGRDLGGIQELLGCLPFAGAVTMDGSRVICDGKVVFERTMPEAAWEKTLAEIRRVGMETLVSGPYGCVIVSHDHTSPFCQMMSHLPFYEDYVAAGKPLEFCKLDFDETSLAACQSSDYLMGNFTYLNVADGYHELVIPGTSKGQGARRFIEALSFEPARFYAFGDSENDLSILDEADVSVVMGNATDKVKAHADYVCDRVDQDGVASALEHLGLI